MNKEYFEWAMNRIETISDEELIEIGSRHGIILKKESDSDQTHPSAAIKALTFPFLEPVRRDE